MLGRLTAFALPLLAAVAVLDTASLHAQPPQPPSLRTGDQPIGEVAFLPAPIPNPPHWVLQQPMPIKRTDGSELVVVDEHGNVDTQSSSAPEDPRHDHDLSSHFIHAEKMPRPTAIPGATRAPVWKTPYSYGHFGATRHRQWSLHHGHQQSFLQWTLK